MSGEDRKRELLAELEKRKVRAQRFGEPTEEIERKIQRIERFGLDAADAAGVSKIGSELRGSKRGRTTAEEPPTKQKARAAEPQVSVRHLLTRKKSLLLVGGARNASVFLSKTSMTRNASSAKRVLDLHPRRIIIAHTPQMPPAHSSACSICGAQPSKYTCPYCSATTCTFECFSAHKTNRVCAHARFEHAKPKPGPPRSLLRQGHSYDYVSMKDYNYNTMIQDYQFLNDVGRMVSQTGRDIADSRMMPTQGAQKPRTAAQHRREHLARHLAFRKLPIMLLPDGMSRRMENRTLWEPKRTLLSFSVAFACPRAKQSADPVLARFRDGFVLHGQPSTADLFRILMDELERSSASASGVSLTQWCVRMPSQEQKRRRTAEDHIRTTWRISRQLLEHLSLSIPPGTLDAGIYNALPDDAVLLMRIYPSRLRNESTPRFLDWWHRKGAMQERDERIERIEPSGPIVPLHVLDNVPHFANTDAPEEEARSPRRTLVRLATGGSNGALPIEQTLRRLPYDFGIVEFPELELWSKQNMLQAERRGEIHVLILHPKQATDTPVGAGSPEEPSGPEMLLHQEKKKATPPAAPTLVSYASSEED